MLINTTLSKRSSYWEAVYIRYGEETSRIYFLKQKTMKKILLILLLSLFFYPAKAYIPWCTSPVWDYVYYCSKFYYTTYNKNTKCDEVKAIKTWELKGSFCDKSYFNSVYPEWYFEEGSLSFWRNYYKNFTLKQDEDKYNNHLFYAVAPTWYEDEHKDIIWKKEDFLWIYVDWKRVIQYAPYGYKWKYYDSEIYFNDNWNQLVNNITDKYWRFLSNRSWTPSTDYSSHNLRPRTRNILDFFVKKVNIKDIEKVLQNIYALREKYSDEEIDRNIFMTEVLEYIELELKVKNLLSDEGWIRYVKYHESW